jgi:hypothetical protein
MNLLLNKLSNLVSYILHPMLMPTYMLAFLLNSKAFFMIPIPPHLSKYVYGIIICFTIILPLTFAMYLKRNGVITSLKMAEKSERNTPFLFTAGCYLGVFYVMNRTHLTLLLNIMLLGAAISLLLLLVMNYKTKISAHAVGIGGALGTILCMQFFMNVNLILYTLFAILLCGIVGSSRLILKAHNHKQIYTGFGLGIIGQFIIFSVYKYFVF